jgi:hypothetical protein
MSRSRVLALAALFLLAGCAITQAVKPVRTAGITSLCIKNNPQVRMDGFAPELRAQIEKKGIRTTMFEGERPATCKYHVEYTANWRWDLAMYLVYAQINVHEDGLLIGQATYDARAGGGRPDKFGPTAEKLKSLLDALLVAN